MINLLQIGAPQDIASRLPKGQLIQIKLEIDTEGLRTRLEERFAVVNFDQAQEDIAPFLKDPRELSLWNSGFFAALIP